MNKHHYILIMAGGEGTRFHPVSTPEKPKQFLSFWGERTFIQQTYARVAGLVPNENIFVATNERYVDLVHEQLPSILTENIIGEPLKKNTAPCIAFASKMIFERDRNAVMAVLPSDQVITKEDLFQAILKGAQYLASVQDFIVTLGIEPTWPADCYGYIKMGQVKENDRDNKWHAHCVSAFVEKPSVTKAGEYLCEGDYVWNSGIFVWKASLILDEIGKYIPQMKQTLGKCKELSQIRSFFETVESISIDYGVMEKSKKVVTIPCNIGWSDIGTWQSLYNLSKSRSIRLEPNINKIMLQQLAD